MIRLQHALLACLLLLEQGYLQLLCQFLVPPRVINDLLLYLIQLLHDYIILTLHCPYPLEQRVHLSLLLQICRLQLLLLLAVLCVIGLQVVGQIIEALDLLGGRVIKLIVLYPERGKLSLSLSKVG